MTNADKFKRTFGLYATEVWAMPEQDFLEWLNSEEMNKENPCENCQEFDCYGCKYKDGEADDE